jgi:thiamine-monophosphate kinase
MNLSDLGEFGLIERLRRRLAGAGAAPAAGTVVHGIGDDAAILGAPAGSELVATIDALIEEVHFRKDWSRPEDVGWKSLAVNVSDLGAMGARPLGALVTLAAPVWTPVRWIDRLYEGLAECARLYGCPVVGGDTIRSPASIAISVAALGSVPAGRAVLRTGAQRGDLVCVTGVVGDSGAALELLRRGKTVSGKRYRSLLEWHFRPRPPVAAGSALAEAGLASSMLDLSDGLASDLQHIARGSKVGIRIEAARLPISDAARQAAREMDTDPVRWALFGGEDYQLLFTVPQSRFQEVPPALGPLGVTATVIGRAVGRGVSITWPDGRTGPLRAQGWAHFGVESE